MYIRKYVHQVILILISQFVPCRCGYNMLPTDLLSYVLLIFPVICTIFGLVAEIKVGIEVSIRMTSRMSQLVSACDVLVVAVTAGAGVYGAPRRMKKLLQFMEHIASVCIDLPFFIHIFK